MHKLRNVASLTGAALLTLLASCATPEDAVRYLAGGVKQDPKTL